MKYIQDSSKGSFIAAFDCIKLFAAVLTVTRIKAHSLFPRGDEAHPYYVYHSSVGL
jgi:hypothetical protein